MKKWYALSYFVIVLMAINSIQVLSITQLSNNSDYFSENNTTPEGIFDQFELGSKDEVPTVYTDFSVVIIPQWVALKLMSWILMYSCLMIG
ncbi:MAG: hypothetical protein ACTSPT_09750 [Candidatus Heimdallarchaeota archaeon]